MNDKYCDEELFQLGLYSICEALHMSLMGTSDPLPEESVEAYLNYLQYRLDNWTLSTETSMFWDEAIYDLCSATIEEYRKAREND